MAKEKKSRAMIWVRFVLPALIVFSGIALAAITRTTAGAEGGALLVSAGLAVLLLNLLFRFGVSGDRDRDREEEARAYYEKHVRWPGE